MIKHVGLCFIYFAGILVDVKGAIAMGVQGFNIKSTKTKNVVGDDGMMNADAMKKHMMAIDSAVYDVYGEKSRYTCTIAGGGALAILGCLSERKTDDGDVLHGSSELSGIMEKFGFNRSISAYIDQFPYNHEDRVVPIELPTRCVDFFTISLEDVVISKLSSERGEDERDLQYPEIVEAIDWTKLETAAAEMNDTCLSPRRLQIFQENYGSYVKEHGK